MPRVPFSVYDVFAYLSSGFLLLGTVDYLYGSQWLLLKEHTAILSLLALFSAYVAGHVLAHLSSAVLEHLFVGRVLRRPAETLMGCKRRLLSSFFPLYYRPLEPETQERVRRQARRRGFEGSGESLFAHAFGLIKREANTTSRLEHFRNLYGFARNLAFTLLVVSVLLLVGPIDSRPAPHTVWVLVSFTSAIAMLYRYLKFHRQFAYELLVTYAELDDKETQVG